MKIFYTLLFLSFSLLAHCQFLRIDSILYERPDSVYTTSYGYNEDFKLSTINNVDGRFNYIYTYGENDRINNIYFEDETDSADFLFFYDENDNLTNLHYINKGETEPLVYFNISEENGLIKENISFINFYGSLLEFYNLSYLYDDQNRLSSIVEVHPIETEQTISITDFSYNENSKLKKVEFQDIEEPENNFLDTLLFNQDGLTEKISRLLNKDSTILEINFVNPTHTTDDEFISPFKHYELFHLVLFDDSPELRYPMFNKDTPVTSYFNSTDDEFEMTWFFSLFTDTKEIPAQLISVFPNPTADFVNIEVEAVEKVEIYSVSGELLKTDLSQENTIDLTSLSSGTYFLMIYSAEGKNYLSKVVKQ